MTSSFRGAHAPLNEGARIVPPRTSRSSSALPRLPEEERLFLLEAAHERLSAESPGLNQLLHEVFSLVFATAARNGWWKLCRCRLQYPVFRTLYLQAVGQRASRRRVELCLRQSDFLGLVTASAESIPELLLRTEERLTDEAVASGTAFRVLQHFERQKSLWIREQTLRALPFLLLLGALTFSVVAGVVVIDRHTESGLLARALQWLVFLRDLIP